MLLTLRLGYQRFKDLGDKLMKRCMKTILDVTTIAYRTWDFSTIFISRTWYLIFLIYNFSFALTYKNRTTVSLGCQHWRCESNPERCSTLDFNYNWLGLSAFQLKIGGSIRALRFHLPIKSNQHETAYKCI